MNISWDAILKPGKEIQRDIFHHSSVTKEVLLDTILSEIDQEFPTGLYTCIDENDKELSVQITDAEDKVNELFWKGSFVQFRTALEEYRMIHIKAAEKMMHKR